MLNFKNEDGMTIIYSNCKDVDCSLLPDIWANLDCNVIEVTPDKGRCDEWVNEAIKNEDDTIIFAGHGSPCGLFHPNMFNGYLLDYENVGLIHAKNVICIWCHASDFCKRHSLKCLCSSMFVSNPGEAACYGMEGSREHISEIVTRFCKELNHCLVNKMPLSETYEYLAARTDTGDEIDTYNRNGVMLND